MSIINSENEDDDKILKLFQNYKTFCQNKINDSNSSIEDKISIMNTIIDNLFEQNEQLIETIIETKKNSKIKSMDINRFMLETAVKTIDVGQALTSYELEMKNFLQQKLPKYLNVIEQQSNDMNNLIQDNNELRKENQLLHMEIDKINAELLQYKQQIVCSNNSMPIICSNPKLPLTKIFIETKLIEQETTINSMICASIVDELIDTIIDEQQQQEDDIETIESNDNLTTIDEWSEFNNIDDDDLKFKDEWCDELIEINNNSNNNSLIPIKINNYRFLSLMAIMLNEIEYKNTVINVMKNNLYYKRKKFLQLNYRFIERGLQMLKFLINLIDFIQNNNNNNDNNDHDIDHIDINNINDKKSSIEINTIQTMAMDIENEIKQIVFNNDNNDNLSTITI